MFLASPKGLTQTDSYFWNINLDIVIFRLIQNFCYDANHFKICTRVQGSQIYCNITNCSQHYSLWFYECIYYSYYHIKYRTMCTNMRSYHWKYMCRILTTTNTAATTPTICVWNIIMDKQHASTTLEKQWIITKIQDCLELVSSIFHYSINKNWWEGES